MKNRTVFLLCAALWLLPASRAAAYNNVSSPDVTKGQFNFEVRSGWDFDDTKKKNGQHVDKFVADYGLTSRWQTKVKLDMGGKNDDFRTTTIEWSNRFQLLKDGEAPVRVAVEENYKRSVLHGTASVIEGVILGSGDTGPLRHTANLMFDRQTGQYAKPGTALNFGWNSRYKYSKAVQPGVELYGNLGNISGFPATKGPDQFQLGPVVQGQAGNGFKYDVGYLFGLNERTPDGRVKVILGYRF